jgi:hypothetical protein
MLTGKHDGVEMPKGLKGEKRPADVIGAAVKVMKIATGEIAEDIEPEHLASAAAELGRRGGQARAAKLSKRQRTAIARKAADSRRQRRVANPATWYHINHVDRRFAFLP